MHQKDMISAKTSCWIVFDGGDRAVLVGLCMLWSALRKVYVGAFISSIDTVIIDGIKQLFDSLSFDSLQ
jgi:hypothetical protein